MMARKKVERKVTEDPRYHNTWKLLKKYRDVVWSLELSVQQVRTQFQIEYDTSIEDFLESIYLAGADLGGTDIEHQAQCIERSHKMLTLVQNAVDLPVPGTKTENRTIGSCTIPTCLPSSSKMWKKSSSSCVSISTTSASAPTTAARRRRLRR